MVNPDELSEDTADRRLSLPDLVEITVAELQRFPSPGTQRALKAETGKDYMALVGPKADSADRTQTQVWTHLRKSVPDLHWGDCEDVALSITDGTAASLDPTRLEAFVPSPDSADSGE